MGKPSALEAIATGTVATLAVLCLSGLCFGFNALYPLLYHEGVMVGRCPRARAEECLAAGNATECCSDQLESYTLMTQLSFFAQDGVMLVYGEIMDRRGPRAALASACMICNVALATLLAGSFNVSIDLLWYVGFFLLVPGSATAVCIEKPLSSYFGRA